MAHSLDVLKFYEQDVKPAIEKNSNEYIQNLIKTADFNHDSVSKFENSIAKDSKQIDAYNKRIINKSWFGGLLWFFLIAAITTIALSIFFMVYYRSDKLIPIILISVSVVLIAILILCFVKRHKENKIIRPIIQSRDKSINLAKRELSTITRLISKKECLGLLEKSFPQLMINDTFTNVDTNLWKDVLKDHEASSVYSEIHGTAHSSPFLFLTTKRIEIVPHVYTGTTTVTVTRRQMNPTTKNWETTATVHVVSASITRPKPAFNCHSKLYFKTKLYPELEYFNSEPFTRESQVKNFYERNKGQRLMENREFDLLFPCKRNNEIQFKATFQMYAQEQIVELIKKNAINKLEMEKVRDIVEVKCINDLTCARINLFGESFLDYSIDRITKNFNITMCLIMSGLYTYFAPLFAISLYQNEKYQIDSEKLSKSNPNAIKFNLENFFNSNDFFDPKYFHPSTSHIVFDAIPKFQIISNTKSYTIASMDSYSFSSTPRIHYETVFAYGQSVQVPIHWDEYNEIHNEHLVLSFHVNDNKQDFKYVTSDGDEFKKHSIIEIFKSMNRVCLTFDSNVKSINDKAETLIEIVKEKFKLA